MCLCPGLVRSDLARPLALRTAQARAEGGDNDNDDDDDDKHDGRALLTPHAVGRGSCTCDVFGTDTLAGRAPYCKHLLAVRLCALQEWAGLNVRHITAAQLGDWVHAAMTTP